MRVKNVLFVCCHFNALISGSTFLSFDKGPVAVLKKALLRQLKNHRTRFFRITLSQSERQIDIPVCACPGFFKVGRQTSQYLLGKNIRPQKRKHEALKIHLPLPAMRLYTLAFVIGYQVRILVNESDQEPVSVGIIVDRYLHSAISVAPEISVFGCPASRNLQMTGMPFKKGQNQLKRSFRNVLRQNVSFLFHANDQGVEFDTCSTLPLYKSWPLTTNCAT